MSSSPTGINLAKLVRWPNFEAQTAANWRQKADKHARQKYRRQQRRIQYETNSHINGPVLCELKPPPHYTIYHILSEILEYHRLRLVELGNTVGESKWS